MITNFRSLLYNRVQFWCGLGTLTTWLSSLSAITTRRYNLYMESMDNVTFVDKPGRPDIEITKGGMVDFTDRSS